MEDTNTGDILKSLKTVCEERKQHDQNCLKFLLKNKQEILEAKHNFPYDYNLGLAYQRLQNGKMAHFHWQKAFKQGVVWQNPLVSSASHLPISSWWILAPRPYQQGLFLSFILVFILSCRFLPKSFTKKYKIVMILAVVGTSFFYALTDLGREHWQIAVTMKQTAVYDGPSTIFIEKDLLPSDHQVLLYLPSLIDHQKNPGQEWAKVIYPITLGNFYAAAWEHLIDLVLQNNSFLKREANEAHKREFLENEGINSWVKSKNVSVI